MRGVNKIIMVKEINVIEANTYSVQVDIAENTKTEDIQYAAEMEVSSGNGNLINSEYEVLNIPNDFPVDVFVFHQLRAAVQLLQYHADIPTICAYIANIWQEGLITDSQEEILYNLADPESECDNPEEVWNSMNITEISNPLYRIARGLDLKKEAA